MIKGSMNLKVKEKGIHKDVIINEGEIFLLPSRIPHSPQRFDNTIGLVVERQRYRSETDCLRWYNQDDELIYEEYFYCTDLGQALVPIIKRYRDSEQFKTQKPIPSQLESNPPITPNTELTLDAPFPLREWVNEFKVSEKATDELFGKGEFSMRIFNRKYQSEIVNKKESWIWQWSGESSILIGGSKEATLLKEGESYLVGGGEPFTIEKGCEECLIFVITNQKEEI